MISLMRHARHALLLLAFAASAYGGGLHGPASPRIATPSQDPPRETAPAPAFGVILGRVLDRDTGLSVPRARVELLSLDGSRVRAELSDSTGRYRFTSVEPDAYVLRAWKAGYAVRATEVLGRLGDSQTIEIKPGVTIEQVNLRIQRGGVIAGRVWDPDGQPAAWIVVEAQRPQAVGGQLTLGTIGVAMTDDEGVFRLFGLPPNDYFISAYDGILEALEGAKADARQRRFAPSYFPGTLFLADASRMSVQGGEVVTGADFQISFVTPSRVSGQVTAFDGRPLQSGTVSISPYPEGRYQAGFSTGALMGPDGTFTFTSIPPGQYIIRARGDRPSLEVSLFGSFLTAVEDGDLTNILITLRPGALLAGTVEFESSERPPPQDLTSIIVTTLLADFGIAAAGTLGLVRSNGTFELSATDSDLLIRLENVPAPWTLKSITYRGRDVTDRPLRIASGDHLYEIRVVLTDQTTAVAGDVRDTSGRPVNDRAIVTVPIDQSLWRPNSRYIRLTYPNFDGHYEIHGLPPGDYYVAAVEPLDEADLLDQQILRQLTARGVRLTLEAGQPAVLDLLPVSRPDPED